MASAGGWMSWMRARSVRMLCCWPSLRNARARARYANGLYYRGTSATVAGAAADADAGIEPRDPFARRLVTDAVPRLTVESKRVFK